MLNTIVKDYERCGGKGCNIPGMFLRFLYFAGFRAVVLHRIGNWFCRHRLRIVGKLLECFMHHLCHCWISSQAEIGEGFLVAHVCGLVIGGGVVIGKNCDVRQNVTMGGNFNKTDADGRMFPTLGDNISVGAGAVIIGPVKIGNNCIIGANSVINRDVPENVIVAGNPYRVIKERWPEESGRRL